MNTKKPVTAVITVLASAAVLTGLVLPSASADTEVTPSVSVTRSFKGVQSRDAKILAESTSVQVDANYGGIEALNVPKTKSQAEIEAEQAEQRQVEAAQRQVEAAQRQAAAAAQQAAASRSAARSAVSVAVSANGNKVVSTAMQYLGAPYVYGGTTPAGWDCSGFTSYVFAQLGINIGRTDAAQRAYGIAHGVRVTDPQPGDLMWKPGHVGIYLGGGKMIHAATPELGTLIGSSNWANFEYYRIVQ